MEQDMYTEYSRDTFDENYATCLIPEGLNLRH